MLPSFSLIIPVLNEEEILEENIKKCVADFERLGIDYEIIIIDDGSTDASNRIAVAIAEKNPRVRLVVHEKNYGVGKAISTGIQAAGKDWVFVNPIDLPFDILEIKNFTDRFNQYDLIVVSRVDRSANPFFRKMTSLVNYWLIKLLFNAPFTDFQHVQFYRRSLIKDLKINSTDSFGPPELILRLYAQGVRYTEVKAPFLPRLGGKSKYYIIGRYFKAIKEMLAFRKRCKRRLKD